MDQLSTDFQALRIATSPGCSPAAERPSDAGQDFNNLSYPYNNLILILYIIILSYIIFIILSYPYISANADNFVFIKVVTIVQLITNRSR